MQNTTSRFDLGENNSVYKKFSTFLFSSRLVCAIDVTEEMDNIVLTVPVATNDARNS